MKYLKLFFLIFLFLACTVFAREEKERKPEELNTELWGELTQKYNLVTIFTNLDSTHLSNYRNLRNTLYYTVDEIVRMKQLGQCTCIDLVKKQERAVIVDFAKGQLRLEEFGMVM